MDVSMQLIRQHCTQSLKEYTWCVDSNPGTWAKNCDRQRLQLASCAQSHPTIKQIKRKCSSTYKDYDRCVRCNPDNVLSCCEELRRFSSCADNYVPKQSVVTFTASRSSES